MGNIYGRLTGHRRWLIIFIGALLGLSASLGEKRRMKDEG